VSCAPLPERHPGPSNSVKNPTSAPLDELPPAVAQSSCSPLGMLGHNQPDEFRTHGVAGRPVLTDLATTAGRHEKVQTYEVVNPDSGVHDAWQPTRKSAARAVLQTSTTTATCHPTGFGAALRAQPPIWVRLRKSEAKRPQVQIPNQDTVTPTSVSTGPTPSKAGGVAVGGDAFGHPQLMFEGSYRHAQRWDLCRSSQQIASQNPALSGVSGIRLTSCNSGRFR
jgi:hypothetical protein